jgi:membrane protease subunit HflK
VIANAEGEAARFRQVVAEYDRAPAVTRNRMYLETMEKILSNTSTVIVDQKAGGNLLFLPLDKLLQLSGSSSANPGSAPEPSAALPPADAPPQAAPPLGMDTSRSSRDSLRSRDREGRP